MLAYLLNKDDYTSQIIDYIEIINNNINIYKTNNSFIIDSDLILKHDMLFKNNNRKYLMFIYNNEYYKYRIIVNIDNLNDIKLYRFCHHINKYKEFWDINKNVYVYNKSNQKSIVKNINNLSYTSYTIDKNIMFTTKLNNKTYKIYMYSNKTYNIFKTYGQIFYNFSFIYYNYKIYILYFGSYLNNIKYLNIYYLKKNNKIFNLFIF